MLGLFRKRHPLELEAERAANLIQSALTRMNLAYRTKARKQVEQIQQVQFVEPLIVTPESIRLEIDAIRLPRGVTITDLRDPKVVETLSAACKRPVTFEQKKKKGESGCWFIVELQERTTIPRMVKFSDMVMPQKATPLMLPIGVTHNGVQVWEDLRDLPHLLVGGATKQGKSVAINNILCHMIQQLPPDRLQLWLADLKGGMELGFYEAVPHVKRLVEKNVDLPDMLLDLQQEMDRRTMLLRGKARDIDGYNYQVGKDKALPYIVVIIDEIANAMLSSNKVTINGVKMSIGKASDELLGDIAARARATGIHLIISTQRPSVDVVTGLIKANFPCRIAFGTASDIDSRVIIDDSGAAGLTVGRMKFRRNMDLLDIQGPFLSDAQVQKIVKQVSEGKATPQAAPESEAEKQKRIALLLLDIGMHDFGGSFPIKGLFKHPEVVKMGIGRNDIEGIALALEQQEILKKPIGPRARVINPARLPKALREASGQRPAASEKDANTIPVAIGPDAEISSNDDVDIDVPASFLKAFEPPTQPEESPDDDTDQSTP